jgi:hypothetical protein
LNDGEDLFAGVQRKGEQQYDGRHTAIKGSHRASPGVDGGLRTVLARVWRDSFYAYAERLQQKYRRWRTVTEDGISSALSGGNRVAEGSCPER